jgi:cysteine dioxygenase
MQTRTSPWVTVARRPLAQLSHDLRAMGDLRRHAARVDERLDGLRMALDALRGQIAQRPRRYARTLVHRDARFELLVLSWPLGCASPVHDHDGQDCWFLPLAGAFDLDDYALLDGARAPADDRGGPARLVLLRARRVVAGELDRRDVYQAIHAVKAVTPDALSLHVYARPLDRCRVYDLRCGRWSWRNLCYDALAAHLGE